MKLGITGHQRLSDECWPWVRQEVKSIFLKHSNGEHGATQAFTSLAIGADQEFAKIAIEYAAELCVIVPSAGYENTFKSTDALACYRELLGKASFVKVLDYAQPCEEAFMAAGKEIVDTVDLLVTVWNGEKAVGTGGTGDAVAYALSRGVNIVHVNPVAKTVSILRSAAN